MRSEAFRFFVLRFRARSAYKLLQLDEEFNILNDTVKRAVDLCAAPGSWSQVLASLLLRIGENATKIVSVDLQEMAPIEGVTTLQGDITSQATVEAILAACGGELADLVVCDGAPDVTGLHDLDEYVQFQLLLSALDISSRLLRRGGTFVAKVFRGENIDLLVAKVRLFFTDGVWVAKPKSSRNSSIECFIVAKGFREIEETETTAVSQATRVDFLSCGDMNGWDADRNYSISRGNAYVAPIQLPTNPAYRAALEEAGRGKWSVQQ